MLTPKGKNMSSAAQATANLANAQLSTGPRTELGKQHSSHNSLKHGLTASTVLIPGEDPAAYDKFKQDLIAYWKPEGPGEVAFVDELISIQWRLQRCDRLEAAIFSVDVPDFKAFNNVSLHAARLKRQYSATFKELAEVQKCRFFNTQEKLKQAELIRRADVAKGRTTDLSEYGFDFTVEYIDQRIARQNQVEAATRTMTQPGFRRAG
jgi:hypothetical protein